MSKKFNYLRTKIFNEFISGKFGIPRIPSDNDVNTVINKLTKDDSEPMLINKPLINLNFKEVFNKFGNTIDDISIIINDTNRQSLEIYNQLSNSIKEYNGIKRDLRILNAKADDVLVSRSGKDFIRCTFTETFNSLDYINTYLSATNISTGSPIIDTKSGLVTIPTNNLAIIDLSHYFDKKLDMVHSNYVGTIVSASYMGHSNAGVMLNTADNNRLVYKVQLDRPSFLTSSFVLQLTNDRKSKDINAILLDVDSSMSFTIKIYYKSANGWEIIPTLPDINITNDSNSLTFETISTTHLKFEMIKEQPDILDSNEYYFIFNNLVISEDTNTKSAFIYSKPVSFVSIFNKPTAISNVAIEINGIFPNESEVTPYIAKDILVPGWFTDSYQNLVDPSSPNITMFIKDPDGYNFDNRYKYIHLSDIKQHLDVDGASDYHNIDFNWVAVSPFNKKDGLNPKVVKFNDLFTKKLYDNSLVGFNPLLFGSDLFIPTRDEFPDWIVSGPVSETHQILDYNNLLSPDGPITYSSDSMVAVDENGDPLVPTKSLALKRLDETGIIDDETLKGFPVGYINPWNGRFITFGDSVNFQNNTKSGWYRPNVSMVTPTNLNVIDDVAKDIYPDFYFNGIKFYKIYKFREPVIASSIKIYNYPIRPNNNTTDYYPHNMKWNYKTVTKVNVISAGIITTEDSTNPNDDVFTITDKNIVIGSLKKVKYVNDVVMLSENIHFDTIYNTDNLVVNISKLKSSPFWRNGSNLSFEYTTSVLDTSDSHWLGYLLVDTASTLRLTLNKLTGSGSSTLVNKVIVADLDGNNIYDSSSENISTISSKTITIDNAGTYVIKVFVTTVGSTPNWNPYESKYITVSKGIRLVPTITPLKIIDFDVLLYSTQYENDTRAALITDFDDSQFIVIKEPAKDIFPGYFYDNTDNTYKVTPELLIKNNNHYYREQVIRNYDTQTYDIYKYTTGSKDVTLYKSENIIPANIDDTWNGGTLFPIGMKNTINGVIDNDTWFDNISTYGHPIHVGDQEDKQGHLFYNTAENLPAFYTIEYSSNRDLLSTDKILYKLELKTKEVAPIVDSIKLTANVLEEEYAL